VRAGKVGAGESGHAGSCQECAWARAWLQISARAFHRIHKLARTIAGLAGSERIETARLAEAIHYRPRRAV
jgi:predicted ATPase with chaperone activity